MTTNKDSAELEGTEVQPKTEGSDKGSGQRNSEADFVTKQDFEKLARQLESISKGLQSSKDRAVKQTNERLDSVEQSLKEVLRSAKQQGRSVEDLLADEEERERRETEQLLRQLALQTLGKTSQKVDGGTSSAEFVDTSEVIEELELPAEDVRVKELATRKFASKEEAYREAAKLVKSLMKQPSDADRSSEEARRKTYASQQEALQAEYEAGSKNLYGNALINYKQQMRKKGLRIS